MDKVKYLHFWVQKILPLVYDDSLSFYELLNKVVSKLNETITITNENLETIRSVVIEWLEENSPETILGLDKLKTFDTPLDYKTSITASDDDMFRNLLQALESGKNQGVIPPGNYTLNRGYVTDEDYIISDQGTYTVNGLSISKNIDFEMYLKIVAEKTNQELHGTNALTPQGACYCPDRNSIFVAFLNSSDITGAKIIEFDLSLNVIHSAFVNIYHGAGLMYDEKTRQLVAVGGNDDPYHYVYFIDSATLAITESKNINSTRPLHGISRDSAGNWFLVQGSSLVIYDSNWTLIKEFTSQFSDLIAGNGPTAGLSGSTLFQTLTPSYNGQVFLLYNIRGASNEYIANVLGQLNYSKPSFKQIHMGTASGPYSEGESAFFIGDKLYMIENVYATHRIRLIECADLTNSSLLNNQTLGAVGGRLTIPENADLNDYNKKGIFYSKDAATTATLLHAPTSAAAGATLFVEQQGNVNIRQYFVLNTNNFSIYTRFFDEGQNNWTSWRTIPVTDEATNNIINNKSKLIHDTTQLFVIDTATWFGATGNAYFSIPCVFGGTPTISSIQTFLVAKDSAGEINIKDGGYKSLTIDSYENKPYIRFKLEEVSNVAFRNCIGKITLAVNVNFA